MSASTSLGPRANIGLFNVGYHGASPKASVRLELCNEAIRLVAVLLQHPLAKTPATYALASLMTLTAARLPARTDPSGNLIALFDQDCSLWDRTRLNEGMRLLEFSASGAELTTYHIEAAIASVHATARHAEETDWSRIISLYDSLMRLNASPIVALNRAIAVAQRDGPERGLETIKAIPNADRLDGYPFYPAAVGELLVRAGSVERAREYFEQALARARNPVERRFFEQKLAADLPGARSTAMPFWESSFESSQESDDEH